MAKLIKNTKELARIKEGGIILGHILKQLSEMIKPGVSTAELEATACALMKEAGGRPAFKGYKTSKRAQPYPTALCTSINHEIVHAPALPGRLLNDGDIISIDVGLDYKGCFTDTAVTIAVGTIRPEVQKLLDVTEESLKLAIKKMYAGKTLNDIGSTIQNYVEANGFSVVRDLVGHGVGLAVHEAPQVPHYAIKNNEFPNLKLQPGMVLAVEPMVNVGDWRIKFEDDEFTISTVDNKLSAHFEHTIIITDGEPIVTTLFN